MSSRRVRCLTVSLSMAEWRAVLSGDLVDPDVRMRGTVVPTSSSRTDGTSWSASWGSADVVRIVEEFEPILDRKTSRSRSCSGVTVGAVQHAPLIRPRGTHANRRQGQRSDRTFLLIAGEAEVRGSAGHHTRPRAGANAPRAKLIPRSSVRWTPTVCHPTLRESRGGISPRGDPVSE